MAEHLSQEESTEVKKTIKMIGSDAQDESEAIEVSKKVAMMSQIFKDMLEMCSEDDKVVKIPNVEGAILQKVLEWAEFHKDDPPFVKEEESVYPRTENEMCDFDRKIFTSLDQETVFKIILAANFLDIPGLIDVSCQQAAEYIKGKEPEEIRELFNIECDLSDEQLAQIRKENEWCEEK